MWTEIISHLQQVGLSQAQIAEKIGCSQPTVHRLYSGDTRDPGFSVGSNLIRLAKQNGYLLPADLRPDIFGPVEADRGAA